LSKTLKPLVYNKTPRRHAATGFIFIFIFHQTPQNSTYGGFGGVKKSYINQQSTFRAPFSAIFSSGGVEALVRGSRSYH
jgi:hypothetical protein